MQDTKTSPTTITAEHIGLHVPQLPMEYTLHVIICLHAI